MNAKLQMHKNKSEADVLREWILRILGELSILWRF